jgi:hypothetical protein
MGKTSLLRQLEWYTMDGNSHLVPLFLDLQGCESMQDLTDELIMSLEDQAERFAAYDVDTDQIVGNNVVQILRFVQRQLRPHDKQLFLLIDEGEALINIGAEDPNGLARLRKLFQNGNLRTVIAATKFLMKLNELTRDWTTSPFLFGFSLVNLWSLDPDSARDLVLQKQNDGTIEVTGRTLDEILAHTHRHPYLIQYLCQRLFESKDESSGRLREITDADLVPDHLLAGFFQVDFDHLSPMERQILLTIARLGLADETTILSEIPNSSASRIRTLIYGMNKLGYLRKIHERWALGNEFLRRWVLDNYDGLIHNVRSEISDRNVESLLIVGRQKELIYLQQELTRWQEQLDWLLEQRSEYGPNTPPELALQIEHARSELATVSAEIQLFHETTASIVGL